MSYINEIILDVDNDIGRIRSGREISRARKTTSIRNEEHRALLKQIAMLIKLISMVGGIFSRGAISHATGVYIVEYSYRTF